MAPTATIRCVERSRDTFSTRAAKVRRLCSGRRGFLILAVIFSTPLLAQSIAEEQRALVTAKRDAAIAADKSGRLEAAAARATDAAAKARAKAAAIAARVQAAESDILAAQARIGIIERLRSGQRARLAAKQQPIVRLTAALETMARRPPALALVQPGSVADLVHVRALLDATMPLIRARTAGLRAELAEADRLRRSADEAVAALRNSQTRLRVQRVALARVEAEQRQRSAMFSSSAMIESDRALALGEQARDIVDLMQELGVQADVRARLAALPGPLPRPPIPADAIPPSAELPPEEQDLDAPAYRLPVVGDVVIGLGEVAASGARARGLTLATAAQAQVVAPSAGRIAFAGPFRSYGRIAIIDHGGGWTSLVAGMAQLAVGVGDTVDRGSPLGTAGPGRPRITVELRHGLQPIDIAALIGAR